MDEQQSSSLWSRAEERYLSGQEVQGIVTRVAQFGVFVQVEPELYVKSVDARRKRLELSLGQETSLPGPLNEGLLPPEALQHRRGASALPQTPGGAQSPVCPACQRQVQSGWKFCVYCGGSLQRRCPACGSTQADLPGARFCHECGKPV